MKINQLSVSEQKAAEKLFAVEPANIPEDPFGFRIWQKEYIERGLRMKFP